MEEIDKMGIINDRCHTKSRHEADSLHAKTPAMLDNEDLGHADWPVQHAHPVTER